MIAGALWHAFDRTEQFSGGPNALEKIIDGFLEAIRNLFTILFSTNDDYTSGQQVMAAGFLLMLISALLWIGASLAGAISGALNRSSPP